MSDDRLRKVFEGPGFDAEASESNATNTKDARIVSALERMVGMTLIEDGFPVTLPGLTLAESSIPDFREVEKIIEYSELTRRIEVFRAVSVAAKAFDEVLTAAPETERAELNRFFRHRLRKVDGIDLASVVIMAGISDAGSETARHIEVAALVKVRSLERLRDTQFTKGRGRRKSARPYHVADILAQFYLKCLKERPTYGLSDGYPSTRFARALQEIFEILGIKAHIRGPAEAAISRITDEDVNWVQPSFNSLMRIATMISK